MVRQEPKSRREMPSVLAQWQESTTTSTRRFFWRPCELSEPSGFVFGATGRVFPYPVDYQLSNPYQHRRDGL